MLGRLLFFNFCHNVISFSLKTFQSNELFEGKNTNLMKDKKLEANLSMVASRVIAGLNMNGVKFLLPLWLGALTGVTVRCAFAAVAFWITSWFVKEAPVTRRQRIGPVSYTHLSFGIRVSRLTKYGHLMKWQPAKAVTD